MNTQSQSASTSSSNSEKWPAQKMALVSKNEMIARFFIEVARSYRWNVIETKSLDDAVSLIKEGGAFALAIEDDATPVIDILRVIQFDPLCLSTPSVFITKRNNINDYFVLKQLAEIQIVFLPATPINMTAGFKEMLDTWQSRDFAAIRFVNYYALRGEVETGIQVLFKLLNTQGPARNLAASILALKLNNAGRGREAEQVLFNVLKDREKNLGCLLVLGYIYLRQGMPVQAKRLFLTATKLYPNFHPLKQDLVQAEILLSEYSEAIHHLNLMIDDSYDVITNVDVLTRLLLVKKLEGAATSLGRKYPEIAKTIIEAWQSLEMQNIMQAG